jgi:hypothetical protein
MASRLFVIALMALALTTTRGRAQDTYTLKLKVAVQGDTYLFRHIDKIKTTSKVVDDNGNSTKGVNDTRSKSFAYVESILQKPADQALPTALRRGYKTAVVNWNDRQQTLPMEGKAILIDRKDDKYSYKLDGGGDLSAEDTAELDLDFTKRTFNFPDRDIMPKKAVKLNDSWTVDPAAVLKGMAKEEQEKFELDKAKLTAKLVKVYDKNNSRFGTIEFQFDLPLAVGVEVGRGFKILGGKLVLQGTFDGCIDGSVFSRQTKVTMTYDIRGSQEDNLMQVLVVMSASGTLEQALEDVGKK